MCYLRKYLNDRGKIRSDVPLRMIITVKFLVALCVWCGSKKMVKIVIAMNMSLNTATKRLRFSFVIVSV